jgi:hypothetical protein
MRGDGQNQRKISAPHPVTETYRLIPLFAALISLDSPFKVMALDACVQTLVHFSPMLQLTCPICMMLAPPLPLSSLNPPSEPHTYAIHEQAKDNIVTLGFSWSDTFMPRTAENYFNDSHAKPGELEAF